MDTPADHDDTDPNEPLGPDAIRPGDPEAHARIAAAVAHELETAFRRRRQPGLHLVATPIGNLGDTSLRSIVTLAQADRVYCEDTRQTLKLLGRFGIHRRLGSYHEHNAETRRPEILAALERGETVALVSDAGTPLVSDPGYKLVRAVLDAGHAVTSVPGPSSVLAALTGSGLPSDTFCFAGFLPPRSGARKSRLAELATIPATLILFETANRLTDTLADMTEVLGPRPAVLARELTKLHEEFVRGPLPDLAASLSRLDLKGECVLVIGPPVHAEATEAEIEEALRAELASSSMRDAVRIVSDRLGVARNRVYTLAVAQRDRS